MKKAVAIILLILAAIMLNGCGSDIEGTWKMTGGSAMPVIYNGTNVSPADMGVELLFRFGGDGSFSISSTGGASIEGASGTWTTDGDTLSITINGSTTDCTYSADGGKLSIFFSYEGHTLSFEFDKA